MVTKTIREIRETNKESQEEISSLLGISQKTYSDYETGRLRFPVDRLIILADHWGVSLDELVGRDTPDKQEVE